MGKRKTAASKVKTLKEREKMAARFRRFRTKHGLTQSQLSGLIDLDRTEISWIENAKRYPYESTVLRLEALEEKAKKGRALRAAARA